MENEPCEIHTAEIRGLESTVQEVQKATDIFKNNKTPDIDSMPAEFLKKGGLILTKKIHQPVCTIWKQEEIHNEWKNSIVIPVFKKGDKTDSRGIITLEESLYFVLAIKDCLKLY